MERHIQCTDMERIFKFMAKKRIYIWMIFLGIMGAMGCAPEVASLDGKLGNGIFYDGKVYWETGTVKNSEDEVMIGKIKKAEEEGVFPNTQFSVTSSMSEYVGEEVYCSNGELYIKKDGKNHVFQFLTDMELGQEKKESPFPDDEAEYPPHLVQENMRYWLNAELSVENIPELFDITGKVKEVCYYAARNNTGNVSGGDEFFVSDFQNRYIIVRYGDNSLSVFENEVYRK